MFSYCKRSFLYLSLALLLVGTGCKLYQSTGTVAHYQYRIGSKYGNDTLVQRMLQPYGDSVNRSMNAFVAELATDLEKAQPEGTLGNIMADALHVMGEQVFGKPVDAAFMNYGGIRLNTIKAGTITRGKMYELFPFDNLLVLLTLKGDLFQQFLNHIASRGGWPVSGMTMQIRDRKAVNVLIGGSPIQSDKIYTIAIGDYTANGGDDAAMLKGIPQENKGFLMRDAIIAYFSSFGAEGKKISLQKENRVSYVQ